MEFIKESIDFSLFIDELIVEISYKFVSFIYSLELEIIFCEDSNDISLVLIEFVVKSVLFSYLNSE